MTQVSNSYRLRSSAFERPEENDQVPPKRIVFLSVEGDETERNYFTLLDQELDASVIHIEVLRHKHGDGLSDPTHAVELLQECFALRQGQLLPPDMEDAIKGITSQYSEADIQAYLNQPDSLDEAVRRGISTELLKLGIDMEYRRYLSDYHTEPDTGTDSDTPQDIFAVVLDRDCDSHSRQQLEECIKHCREKGFGFYLSNPCFEFWLLLHLCDVMEEFDEGQQQQLLENPKVSYQHTMVSREVSERAHHKKTIKAGHFRNKYLPNIRTAIRRSKDFATQLPELMDNLGTNIPDLLEEIGFSPSP